MRDTTLMQMALGLLAPWMVKGVAFDADKKRLDIEIDFTTGGRFACPDCARPECPAHDTVMKTSWRSHASHGRGISTSSSIRPSSPRARRASRAPTAASASSPCPLGEAKLRLGAAGRLRLHAAVRGAGHDAGHGHAGQGGGASDQGARHPAVARHHSLRRGRVGARRPQLSRIARFFSKVDLPWPVLPMISM